MLRKPKYYINRSESHYLDTKKLSVAFSDRSLCARTGTCVGICPHDAIVVGPRYYPEIPDPSRCTQCGKCADACPGSKVDYAQLTRLTFGDDEQVDEFDGRVAEISIARSEDHAMQQGGAGGGVITGLLWDMLRHGDVDGCLVTRMRANAPSRGEPFIATTYEELLQSQGSRYAIIPLNAALQTLRERDGKFAIAALPCHTHGLRVAASLDPELKDKIYAIVGLFCGGGLETFVVDELLEMKGLSPDDIGDFQFRGGEWPGKIRAILNDGTISDMHQSNYKDGAYNYLIGVYMPPRCTTCIDGSCEFSDLSVSDAWTRDQYGKYVYKGHSRVLARTEHGVQILHKAIARGSLTGRDVSKDKAYKTHRIQTTRKGINARLRVARLERAGKRMPKYDRHPPETSFKERFMERAITAVLTLGQKRWFRYPLIKFLTSEAALPLIRIRLFLKNRKYRKAASPSPDE